MATAQKSSSRNAADRTGLSAGEKAALRETDRSVTDICFDVGFTSRGTFSRMFREIVGEAPSDYRVGHGPMVAPNCFQMWAMRPVVAAGVAMRSSSFGDAAAEVAP